MAAAASRIFPTRYADAWSDTRGRRAKRSSVESPTTIGCCCWMHVGQEMWKRSSILYRRATRMRTGEALVGTTRARKLSRRCGAQRPFVKSRLSNVQRGTKPERTRSRISERRLFVRLAAGSILTIQKIFPNIQVTKLLLERKADVNAQNEDGQTPLRVASRRRNFSNQIVKLLLDHGAHLDVPDERGKTPAYILSATPDDTVDFANYTTLRCLASQAVAKYEIPCNDLPATLNEFLDLHRPL